MNIACIMKLSWKLINNSKELWCKVIRVIYKEINLCRNHTKKNTGSSLWRAINKYILFLMKLGKWSMGDGRRVDAWEDILLEDGFCIKEHV